MPEFYKKFRDSQGLASVSRALQASKATEVIACLPSFTYDRLLAQACPYIRQHVCREPATLRKTGSKMIQRKTKFRGELMPNES